MALSPAPHTPPVFRLLKQAWREYLASGGASLTISNPPNQLATATTPVSGTVTADSSVPTPVPVSVSLVQSSVTKATQTVGADPVTGAYTVTFPASTLAAGSASARASVDYVSPVTSTSFTVT